MDRVIMRCMNLHVFLTRSNVLFILSYNITLIGVDAILNSLAGEKLHASVDILAENGHFLEIGKYDLSENSKLGNV